MISFSCRGTLALCLIAVTAHAAPTIDDLVLGDAASEAQHQLTASKSEVVPGAMKQPARRLLPGGDQPWEGGRLSFTMKVDPKQPNYFTARFWGDEVDKNFLVLFCEGKQVGYRWLGDIDVLTLPDDEPRYNGRFYYSTTPLPRALTAGKTEVHLEIRSNGPVWGYGKTFEEYQRPMTTPSRAIYKVATHIDGCFVPPADEAQGEAPPDKVRDQPGEEVLTAAKKRVNDTLDRLLKSRRPLDQMQAQLLARAYFVKWTVAFQNPKVVEQVIKSADDRYHAWQKDPAAVWHDMATWNPDWFALGPMADAVRLLAPSIGAALDAKLDGEKTRRAAWAEIFRASRDQMRTHRRWYTNQTLFVDMNLYRSHRALVAIDPQNAWPEEQARHYLYEALGLQPWLGADTDQGPEKQWGTNYFQITNKGLSRELGYVGGYGEILGEMVDVYEAAREPGQEGDPKIKAQIAKLQRARLYFRYPMPDEEGFRAMRLETGIGWRDAHFPGPVTYAQRSSLDETPLYAAAITLDPPAVGAAQQMFADNQFFSSIDRMVKDKRLRADFGLLTAPDDYETIRAQPAVAQRLPMSPGNPDTVFADEEEGVVAIRHGGEILYVALYWRSRMGINGLARVHYLTPQYQQVAVVYEDVKFEPSGRVWKRPNWTDFGFGNGGHHYPGKVDSTLTGEALPIPKFPADVPIPKDKEIPFAGRADFYQLRYGPYLIGMNTTKDKTFELPPPPGVDQAPDLVSRHVLPLGGPIKVGPRSTVVLYLPQ
ncbi:MAG: hypothetical protein P4L99_26625 [Chthoniobacter sp.]|nr:hypothetical protein [Chthoniobacter sp.]